MKPYFKHNLPELFYLKRTEFTSSRVLSQRCIPKQWVTCARCTLRDALNNTKWVSCYYTPVFYILKHPSHFSFQGTGYRVSCPISNNCFSSRLNYTYISPEILWCINFDGVYTKSACWKIFTSNARCCEWIRLEWVDEIWYNNWIRSYNYSCNGKQR